MSCSLNESIKGLNLHYCLAKENPQWDAFVASIHGANFEQTSVWAEVCIKNHFCNDYFRIIIYQKKTIIAGAQILIRTYGNYARIGILSQGPCLSENASPETYDILIQEIKKSVKKNNLLYLSTDVFFLLQSLPSLLLKAGFKKAIKELPPHPLIESTAVTDLSQSEEEIFKQFDPRRQRNIKTGYKLDFSIREGDRKDIEVFFILMKSTCKRRGTKPIFSNINYFYSIWDHFHPKGWIKLFIAEVDHHPVCSMMGFTFGDTFRYEYWGWNGEYAKEKITETFQWKNMLMVKKMGFKYYDYVQLDSIVYKAIISEKETPGTIKNRELYGATYFKLLWKGTIFDYPGVYTYYKNKWIQFVLTLVSKFLRLDN